MAANHRQEIARVLLQVAKDPSATIAQKLDAAKQLIEIKQLDRKAQKPRKAPQTALLGR